MKGRSAIVIFLAILFGAATIYFFFSTERGGGLTIEVIVDADQVVVSPKVQGILERLNVDEGSTVRAGELIARLDTAELDADVEADRASVANLRAQLTQSQSNYQLALTETAGRRRFCHPIRLKSAQSRYPLCGDKDRRAKP